MDMHSRFYDGYAAGRGLVLLDRCYKEPPQSVAAIERSEVASTDMYTRFYDGYAAGRGLVLLDRGYKGPPQSVAAIERSEAASNGHVHKALRRPPVSQQPVSRGRTLEPGDNQTCF